MAATPCQTGRMSDDLATWLRAAIEGDKQAALIISNGGFAPQHWDTDPPGAVNPVRDPASLAVSEAIGQEPEYSCGWVQIVVYEREIGDPPEEEYSEPGAVAAIADIGRRQFDHICRHDPRNVAARCEAELAILGEHGGEHMCFENSHDGSTWDWWIGDCRVMRLLGAGYRYRAGYRDEWLPESD